MPRPFQLVGRLILLFAIFANCGGHWVVLKSMAWASMLIDRSRQVPFVEAVKVTFDGGHPCDLCQKIDEARRDEGKQETPVRIGEIELFYEPASVAVCPPETFVVLRLVSAAAESHTHSPPRQPPRTA